MPYEFNWYNSEHTIIRVDISGQVSWEAYNILTDRVVDELAISSHRIDRIYASAELAVTGAGVDYAGQQLADITQRRNLCAGSDHALVWAELKR